jgi:hypothetical protein
MMRRKIARVLRAVARIVEGNMDMPAEVTVLTVFREQNGVIEPAIKSLVAGQAGTTVEWTDISNNSAGVPDEVIVAFGEYEDNQSLDMLLAGVYPGNGDPALVPHLVLGYRHFSGDAEVNIYNDTLGAVPRQQWLNWFAVWKPEASAAAAAQLSATMTRTAAINAVKQIIHPQE